MILNMPLAGPWTFDKDKLNLFGIKTNFISWSSLGSIQNNKKRAEVKPLRHLMSRYEK